MEIERRLVLVIHEKDLTNGDRSVVGVATTRKEALRMIEEYYGIGTDVDAVMTEFEDIRENNLDFSCLITVSGFLGGVYRVWAEDFNINSI